MNRPDKICQTCGRPFEYRKKWEKNWDEVKYCSDRCRSEGRGSHKKKKNQLQDQILQLLNQRSAGKTICPSEILPAEEKQNAVQMETVRQAARLLAHQGLIEITQGGKAVDPDSFRGPIRLRLKNKT